MNVPKLRFPEFEEGWEEKTIKDVARIMYGKDQKEVVSENGKYPILGTGGVIGKTDEYLYNQPSVLIGRKGTIDRPRFMDSPFWTVDTLFYTEILPDTIPKWLYYKFKTINWYLYNEASGVPSLSGSTIYKIKLNQPTLLEQTKIASFLSAVDEKLQALKKKKELLQQYKQGMMQKIFSQKIRFKDDEGNEFGEWEEKKFGDIAIVIMGQSPQSKSYNIEGLGIPLIQGNADVKDRKTNPRNWTTEITKKCCKGDLILTVRAPVGAVAKSVHNACIGRGVCAIRNGSNASIEYIYQFLLNFELKWIKFGQGSTFTAISSSDIKDINIVTPCLKEQTKIANFLSAIDDKINHCQTQIATFEQYKKALLQQMFC